MDWIVQWAGGRADLRRWIGRDFSRTVAEGPHPGDNRDVHERVVAREEPGPPRADGVFRRLAEAVARFDVFPRRLVIPLPEHRPLCLGDTVGLQYHLLPGLDFVFAAQIIERFDGANGGQWRCGFTYRTLHGHPFCGEETFSVEKDIVTGAIRVALRSWSRPASWLARLGRPWVRRIQLRAGRGALDHLEAIARSGPRYVAPAFAPPPPGLGFMRRRDLRTRFLRAGD
jgi:Domain of unknown function (DUF1990)